MLVSPACNIWNLPPNLPADFDPDNNPDFESDREEAEYGLDADDKNF